LGFNTFIVERELHKDVENAAETIINASVNYKKNNDVRKPVCLLYGGEPTLKVNGNGRGGRNQHLALSAAKRLQAVAGITLLSAGTDGTDGPTDAAGAVVDSETVNHAISLNADPEGYLAEFDSYNFFRITGGQIKTGPTFTNVMDMVVVLIE
jgi:hydroxypyruvate reductase/glycerate 2-kinase